MKITSAPSPNFDERTQPVNMLVLHYTGMESGEAALDRMRDPDAKVTAHYMVEENGNIIQLVDEKNRAWHAGVSYWDGENDINSTSIGIEIVNGGHDYGLPDFPDAQIRSVISLCNTSIQKHQIPIFNILGHSDIAPDRKQDPGEKFPWQMLAEQGVGYWPSNISNDRRVLFEFGSRDRGISVLQRGLSFIGYRAEVNSELDSLTKNTIIAVQRRYRPEKCDGAVDVQTVEIITNLAAKKRALGGNATV